ncbi:PREDICTED: lipid droplet-associated hydrolase isoform X2 [Theobroma cacao]|uniref:Lipid droplet-associated hydrolase isoform X2 n=1 Tax=Theobroma cacao TaxID=3641 RepID=A0AB32WIB5_THECC|nr:PREDICTED: lipid droplet-associated hydrolase isoform X2 [Theobroma cacao]
MKKRCPCLQDTAKKWKRHRSTKGVKLGSQMLPRVVSLTSGPLPFIRSFHYRHFQLLIPKTDTANRTNREMGFDDLHSDVKKCVNLRLCNVSGCMTEVLEVHADHPSFHVVFVPGNPGIITFYKEFVESLFELLGGTASVSAVGYAGQTEKNWEHGKLFSLQEQIDHKMEFIKGQNIEVPLVLVGHSIGSYISLEMLRRLPKKAVYCIGLYPFLALNLQSKKQSTIVRIAMSRVPSTVLSFLVASLGLLPRQVLRLIFKLSVGKSWSNTALEAGCSHLPQYHTMRNVLFMARTEFSKLSETPDWEFMRENQDKITFLYGIDDHWGPLEMFEEISKQASGIALSIEREGHTHGFCCTEAGSLWVARHVASLIKNKLAISSW